jgi:hypothetical protein
MMTTLSPVDLEALTRALALARAEGDEERARFDGEMIRRGWEWAAQSASYHRQCRAPQLRPWQAPPCDSHDELGGAGYGRGRAAATPAPRPAFGVGTGPARRAGTGGGCTP